MTEMMELVKMKLEQQLLNMLPMSSGVEESLECGDEREVWTRHSGSQCCN